MKSLVPLLLRVLKCTLTLFIHVIYRYRVEQAISKDVAFTVHITIRPVPEIEWITTIDSLLTINLMNMLQMKVI
jgi:hypothetical protein